MSAPDRELRDEALSRALRGAMSRAPEAWLRDALRVPAAYPAPPPAPRSSPFRILIPHLAGLTLLLGLAMALFLRPEVGEAGWSVLRKVLPDGISLDSLTGAVRSRDPERLAAMLSTPFFMWVLYQGSRGFPILHRGR